MFTLFQSCVGADGCWKDLDQFYKFGRREIKPSGRSSFVCLRTYCRARFYAQYDQKTKKNTFRSEILASLNFNKIKILFPGFKNNHTLKCCSGNFPTYCTALLSTVDIQHQCSNMEPKLAGKLALTVRGNWRLGTEEILQKLSNCKRMSPYLYHESLPITGLYHASKSITLVLSIPWVQVNCNRYLKVQEVLRVKEVAKVPRGTTRSFGPFTLFCRELDLS